MTGTQPQRRQAPSHFWKSRAVSTQGRYRIQAVSKMTGLSTATLRSWERRYGVPSPSRTRSSYRLYSDHDVELVNEMRDMTRAGMAPAEAARTLLARAGAPGLDRVLEDHHIEAFEQAQAGLVEAVRVYDSRLVEERVRQALMLGPAAVVSSKVFVPVLRTVGELWSSGELSVAQEHMLSEVLEGLVREILRLVQPVTPSRRALLACFAEEQHALPLVTAAVQIAQLGYRTLMLGARTPPEALAEAVQALHPVVVGLSVTIAPPLAEAERLLAAYAEAVGDVPWMVGGAAAHSLREPVERLGGRVVDDSDLDDLRSALRELTGGSAATGRTLVSS